MLWDATFTPPFPPLVKHPPRSIWILQENSISPILQKQLIRQYGLGYWEYVQPNPQPSSYYIYTNFTKYGCHQVCLIQSNGRSQRCPMFTCKYIALRVNY